MEKSPTMMISVVACFLFMVTSTVSATVEGPKEVEQWFQQLSQAKQKVTKLHFYFHDILKGDKPTAALVAQANMTDTSPTYFGFVNMVDDPLTLGVDMDSNLVGHMQGFYGTDSLEEISFLMVATFVFTDWRYNGSTLAVMGHNPPLNTYRELSIIGGSGVFRLASGVVTLKTYYANFTTGDAIVEVDVVALHY